MGKRVWALLLAAAMTLTLVGCGEEKGVEAEGFASLAEIMALAAENHKVYTEPGELENVDLTPYAINDTGLLTESEIEALRTERPMASRVTVEEAREDADLFFRTWKYAYSSYYFIGEEPFENARQQVMAELDGKKDGIKGSEFAEMLYKAMSFLRDDHSSINGKSPASTETALIEMAYIDQSVSMDKDEKGYYQTYEDGKWYYTTASDESIRIEPTLLENGKVVYCPLVLAPSGGVSRVDTLTLKKDGAVKEVPISWTMCQNATGGNNSGGFVAAKAMGDVYYINYLDMANDLDDQYWGEYIGAVPSKYDRGVYHAAWTGRGTGGVPEHGKRGEELQGGHI